MNKLTSFFYSTKAYHHLSNLLQKTRIGSHKISVHRLLQIFFSQMRKDHIVERASAMAFNFVLSIFPAIIFIFTLIPVIPIDDLQEKIMTVLKNLLPISIYNGAAAAIYDIIHIPHGGLMSFGFFFAVFTATNGIMAMISAFNKCYKTSEKRGYLKRITTAMTIVFFLLVIVFISIFLAVFSKQYIQKMDLNKEFLYYLILVFKNLLFFLVFLVGISVIYYMAPAITTRWRFFSLGSIIASLLSVFFTLSFSFYVNSFDSYNKLYGSIGAFIGVMLWFYAISIVLLIGFELNASYDLAKREAHKRSRSEQWHGIGGS